MTAENAPFILKEIINKFSYQDTYYQFRELTRSSYLSSSHDTSGLAINLNRKIIGGYRVGNRLAEKLITGNLSKLTKLTRLQR
ncbi:hypothetical protein [Rosenbergiella epipactidis]|uniref:hypothetical protein n=1 Tax=Rosenbergiella epipactidis TaxID=1544694 RepID=UPI001F4E6F0F|nr:hypothetical protein [Rosenbergiella epipactidis]